VRPGAVPVGLGALSALLRAGELPRGRAWFPSASAP